MAKTDETARERPARFEGFYLTLDQIFVEEGLNKREDYGDIHALAKSIAANGVRKPIEVEKVKGEDKYRLISGHRRYRASLLAVAEYGSLWNKETMGRSIKDMLIPAMNEKKGTTLFQRMVNQYVDNDGKQFNLLEQSDLLVATKQAYAEENDGKELNNKELAKLWGQSTTHISNCLLLQTISAAMRKKIMSGKIAPSLVIEELKQKSSEEVEDEVNEAEEGLGEDEKITAGKLPSAGSKDKKVEIKLVEDMYTDVMALTNQKADPFCLEVLTGVAKVLRGTITIDEFADLFMAPQSKRK